MPETALLAASPAVIPILGSVETSLLFRMMPFFLLVGVCLQLSAFFHRRPLWLCVGAACILAAAVPDRDISLAVGDLLATAAIFSQIRHDA